MSMKPEQAERGRRASGSALLLAVFVLALLSTMGIALLSVSQRESEANQAGLRTKRSFFLAEAGQEDGRLTLWAANGSGTFSDDLAARAGANGVLDFNPANIQVSYNSNGVPTGLTGFGDDTPLRGLTPFGGGWYAVFLSNDPIDGTSAVDSNDRVMLTGIGIGQRRSAEVVQAVIERKFLLPTLPPATITLLGPAPDFRGGSSDSALYTGSDCNGTGIPGLHVPVVGTIGSAAEVSAEAGIVYESCCPRRPGPTYSSGSYSAADTFADLTDGGEPTVVTSGFGTIDPDWTDCASVKAMIENLRTGANTYCCTPPNCDPASPPACTPTYGVDRLTFINGNFDLGPSGGSGTLVVTGSLRYDGRASWTGMVLVLGAGSFVRNGAGNGRISGAVVVADVAGPDNIYGTVDDCTGGTGGFDRVLYHMNGGGSSVTSYCQRDILASSPQEPYRVVSFLQR